MDGEIDLRTAERSLRPVVISRKISGGTRSERGTETKMTLASIFGTWRVHGLNPLTACKQLLASHQVSTFTFPAQANPQIASVTGGAAAACEPTANITDARASRITPAKGSP